MIHLYSLKTGKLIYGVRNQDSGYPGGVFSDWDGA